MIEQYIRGRTTFTSDFECRLTVCSFCTIIGFKAHNTHNKCLHARELELNASLASYLGSSGEVAGELNVTVSRNVYNKIVNQLRVCDLDEELANVSGTELLSSFVSLVFTWG